MPKHKIIFDKRQYNQPHAVWDLKSAENVEITHVHPKGIKDKISYYLMKIMRISFDFMSGYRPGHMTEARYLRRCIFLETIAGVPGMIGGMMRHLRAIRGLNYDGGWIHYLLEEAENERMHLLFFLRMRSPGILMRFNIIIAQFIFIVYYTILYTISPTTAHRFVGYLEEEAVKTYTNMIKEIDDGKFRYWATMPADEISKSYWSLPDDAKFRDVLIAIRADEVNHREFNHHFADIPKDQPIDRVDEVYVVDESKAKTYFDDLAKK